MTGPRIVRVSGALAEALGLAGASLYELVRVGTRGLLGEIIRIDGLRVEYPDGFGLARSSNTTPVIVLRFEGDNPEALRRIQEDFRRVLSAAAPEAVLPF